MTRCRWDRDAADYLLPDGQPCRVDEHGDPTLHCTARRTCSVHIGYGDLTCPRCIGRVRSDLRAVRDLSGLLLPQAIHTGINSDAADLAGPTADPGGHLDQRITRNRRDDYAYLDGRIDGDEYLKRMYAEADDDGEHPTNVLGSWVLMLTDDGYGHHPQRITLVSAVAYLERQLTRFAQDPHQDFGQLAREVRDCRSRVEVAIRDHRQVEQGVPCPACVEQSERGKGPRLRRNYGHWCTDEDCEQIHYHDDSGDEWVCPRNHDHRWADDDYRRWVADVYDEQKGRAS